MKSVIQKFIYIALPIILAGTMKTVFSQAISLSDCFEDARENHPLLQQLGYADQIAAYRVENARKQYLPRATVSAQATYQSDITTIPLELPGIEIDPLSQDQYQARLDVSQPIFDAGTTKNRVLLAESKSALEKAQVEASLYQVRASILEIYFGILKIDARTQQLRATLQTLQAQYRKVDAAVENGISLPSNRDAIEVEILAVNQQLIQMSAHRKVYLLQLGTLTGNQYPASTTLQEPAYDGPVFNSPDQHDRPEKEVFREGRNLLEAQQSLTGTKGIPTLAAFGQAGYGKPGLNFLENEFTPYYIVGLKLNWNLSALYTKKNEKEISTLEAVSLEAEESDFNRSLKLRFDRLQSELERVQTSLTEDEKIIQLRQKITRRSTAQLENGTITSADFIRDVNAEANARINRDLHLIEINHLKYQIQDLLGNISINAYEN